MFSKLNEKINYYYKEKKDDLMCVTLFITIPLFLYIFLPTLFEILGIFYPIIIFILESRRSNKRYEEAQRDANNLRLKELEQREDFYRPIFVTTNNGIKLIMKKKNLVIENINFFSDATGRIYKQIMKTDDVISFENTPLESTGVAFPNEFFIFADTMLGERIVFGYFFGGKKYINV